MQVIQIQMDLLQLVLHFDIDHVIRLPPSPQPHHYIHQLFSKHLWGTLQKNDQSDSEKVTGWKPHSQLASSSSPQPQLVSFYEYLQQSKLSEKEIQMKLNELTNGPNQQIIKKAIRNITISKVLYEAIKQWKGVQTDISKKYLETGKYQILPAFFKLLLWLKKNKRNFAICLKNSNEEVKHPEIIEELNLFFNGEHPLYNGKNGTPLVKMDGNNDTRNFYFFDTHYLIIYNFQEEVVGSFGTQQYVMEKDPEMLKQSLKSRKRIKVCENIEETYQYFHSILNEGAFLYELNPTNKFYTNKEHENIHEIYFSHNQTPKIFTYQNQPIENSESIYERVNQFELLTDIDYFIKKLKEKQKKRSAERSNEEVKQEQQQEKVQQKRQSDAQYLKKNIMPLLEGALRQVDLLRPEDPVGFVALHCLRNAERIK